MNRLRFKRLAIAALLFGTLVDQSGIAQPPPDRLLVESADWPTDQVALASGEVLLGLITDESDATIELMEIRRPPGRPLYLVVRPLRRADVVQIKRLANEQRRRTAQRIAQFKNRAQIDAERISSVNLQGGQDGPLIYSGDWFRLESTLGEPTTRLLVVRLNQRFRAYRQVLPPREQHTQKPVGVFVFGSKERYRQFLEGLNLQVDNAAVYLADRRFVVAGSKLDATNAQLAQLAHRHRQLHDDLARLDRELPQRVAELEAALAEDGSSPQQIRSIVLATRQKWESQRNARAAAIAEADTANGQAYNRAVESLCRRLYHEAFHAYLDNYVFDPEKYDVPTWLNEGWAQLFEGGQLEADTLRIEAPAPECLQRLQEVLAADRRLSLEAVLSADQSAFLLAHGEGERSASRHYACAWGLAYYLTFVEPVSAEALQRYVEPLQGETPQDRFETLVGQPLGVFEERWTRAILSLSAPSDSAD
ncbi:MAG: DUF1570 domain-containing protein [Pirellulales bacterium]